MFAFCFRLNRDPKLLSVLAAFVACEAALDAAALPVPFAAPATALRVPAAPVPHGCPPASIGTPPAALPT